MDTFASGVVVGALLTMAFVLTSSTAALVLALRPWTRWAWWRRRAGRSQRVKLHRALSWDPAEDSGVLTMPSSIFANVQPSNKLANGHDPISDVDTLVI